MSVQIIVDSTVDMPERMKDRFRIVPLTVHFGAEEYIDGVTIDKHRFYERLVESDELPTTSQASPAAFDAIFSDVASVGDSAVVGTIASKFSGTYQSACIAAAEYDNIYVADSKSAAIGSGILAEYALECADKGMDAKTIAETLEKKRDEICLIALLDTLEFLVRHVLHAQQKPHELDPLRLPERRHFLVTQVRHQRDTDILDSIIPPPLERRDKHQVGIETHDHLVIEIPLDPDLAGFPLVHLSLHRLVKQETGTRDPHHPIGSPQLDKIR